MIKYPAMPITVPKVPRRYLKFSKNRAHAAIAIIPGINIKKLGNRDAKSESSLGNLIMPIILCS